VPWYLHLALRQLFPTGRRFPFFTLISVLGVALGVAVLLVVMSVMSGFAF
jgi:lipoprotein-releasing system permease protein